MNSNGINEDRERERDEVTQPLKVCGQTVVEDFGGLLFVNRISVLFLCKYRHNIINKNMKKYSYCK